MSSFDPYKTNGTKFSKAQPMEWSGGRAVGRSGSGAKAMGPTQPCWTRATTVVLLACRRLVSSVLLFGFLVSTTTFLFATFRSIALVFPVMINHILLIPCASQSVHSSQLLTHHTSIPQSLFDCSSKRRIKPHFFRLVLHSGL